jgi:nucleoside-triphosphatase THEP1
MEQNPQASKVTSAEAIGRHGFSIGEVVRLEHHFGFEVFDQDKEPRVKFVYTDRAHAEIGREAIFRVLENAISLDGISRR